MNRRMMLATALLAIAIPLTAQKPVVDPLIGTWIVKVPGATPAETFYAVHTFHAGGTFTENSSLLPGLNEGPAQGSWKRDGSQYKLTFQLFSFDAKKQYNGYIRVRCTIRLTQQDRFEADSTVDLIDKEGKVELAIAQSPFQGVRLKIDPAGPPAIIP